MYYYAIYRGKTIWLGLDSASPYLTTESVAIDVLPYSSASTEIFRRQLYRHRVLPIDSELQYHKNVSTATQHDDDAMEVFHELPVQTLEKCF